MDREAFKTRTKQFAMRIVRLYEALPASRLARVIGDQLLRAGTSVGANYRAACRGRSRNEVISKLGIVLEEADETLYWLELLAEAELVKASRLTGLMAEANEIVAMTVTSIRTMRSRSRAVESDV